MLVGFWWCLLPFLGLGPHDSHLCSCLHITSPLCVWNSSSTSSLIRTLVIPFSTHSHNLGWSSHLRIVNHADRDHLSWLLNVCVDNYLLLFRQCSVELSLLEGLDPLLRSGEEWPSAITLLLVTLSQPTSSVSPALGCHHLHSDLESPQVTAHCLLPNRQSQLNSQSCERKVHSHTEPSPKDPLVAWVLSWSAGLLTAEILWCQKVCRSSGASAPEVMCSSEQPGLSQMPACQAVPPLTSIRKATTHLPGPREITQLFKTAQSIAKNSVAWPWNYYCDWRLSPLGRQLWSEFNHKHMGPGGRKWQGPHWHSFLWWAWTCPASETPEWELIYLKQTVGCWIPRLCD